MGMRVIAVDGGEAKRDLCLQLGAEKFIDFTASDVPAEVTKMTTYGAHAAIVFAGSKVSYEQAPLMLRPGGTVVCIGLPKDPAATAGASPMYMCMKGINVVGSKTGTLKEVEEALDFTARGLVRPILKHGGLGDIDRFCKEIGNGTLVGRAVIKVSE
jgi:propanol-preferring alcohol dehydrogenase